MRIRVGLGVFLGAMALTYLALGYPVFGHRVCVFRGQIMSEHDRVTQLLDYVRSRAALKRAAQNGFDMAPAVIDGALAAFDKCVAEAGMAGCSKGVKLKVDHMDVEFGYVDKMFGGAEAGASFLLRSTDGKQVQELDAANFNPLGCWFTGIQD